MCYKLWQILPNRNVLRRSTVSAQWPWIYNEWIQNKSQDPNEIFCLAKVLYKGLPWDSAQMKCLLNIFCEFVAESKCVTNALGTGHMKNSA